MPQKRRPKLRLHKATNAACIELNGHRIYLGKWDNSDVDLKYHSMLAEWELCAGATSASLDITLTLLDSDLFL